MNYASALFMPSERLFDRVEIRFPAHITYSRASHAVALVLLVILFVRLQLYA